MPRVREFDRFSTGRERTIHRRKVIPHAKISGNPLCNYYIHVYGYPKCNKRYEMTVEWIFDTKEYLSIFYSIEYSKKSRKIQKTEEKHCDELPFSLYYRYLCKYSVITYRVAPFEWQNWYVHSSKLSDDRRNEDKIQACWFRSRLQRGATQAERGISLATGNSDSSLQMSLAIIS